MKIKGKVSSTRIDAEGNMFAEIQCNGKLPPQDTLITLSFGKVRSLKSNSLYWVFLEYALENGMKDQGYQFTEDLHTALKNRILTKYDESKGFKTLIVGSTTELTSDLFMEYLEKCEAIMVEYCGMNFRPFWIEYGENYGKG